MASQHPTTQYATDVVYGNIIACQWEIKACKRHLRDLERQGTDNFPFVFDETRANRIFDWFKLCRHVRGAFSGKPIELDDWQKFDLGSIFGWVHKTSGKRRFKVGYIRVARGNGKSTIMSGIALYGMCGDAIYPPYHPELARYEISPEIVCAAVDKEQANIVWGDAREMALASPDILKRLKVAKTYISHKTRCGAFKKMSKDVNNKDGGAPCMVIIDELHKHRTSEVKDTLMSGMGKREQCLAPSITTAGTDAENSICKKEDDIAKKILIDEIVDETYFAVIREIDDEDNPHDESCWPKANPIFRNMNAYSEEIFDTMKREHNLAFGSGDPAKIREWMIKRVDRWQTDAENKYMSGCMDKWKALAVPRDEFSKLIYNTEGFYGDDLSKTTDLTADAYVTWLPDGRLAVTAHGFIPEERATQHEHSDRVPYKHWAKDNWCTLTSGAVVDYNFIESHMHDMEFDHKIIIKEICYDPYNATQYANNLTGQGYTCVEIRQGVQTLSEATKKFRELVLQGKIVHDGNPLLTWCLSNAVEVSDNNGNIKLSKKHKDDSQRIDLLAAVINALVRALVFEEEPQGRVFFV